MYEKVIVERILQTYKEQGLERPNQFGFRKGKGADDVFIHLRNAVKYNDKKYTLVIFVDIEGAFDNIWWPAVLARVADTNYSSRIFNIVRNYFKHRKVTIESVSKQYSRRMQKGCLQGSIIGPAAWVWCMDVLLKEIQENVSGEHAGTIAYADNLVCVIKGDTRLALEDHARRVMEIIVNFTN